MPIEQPMSDNQYSLQSQNHRCLRRNERIYIGITAGTFKKRYANHMKSLKVQRYSTETELSKYEQTTDKTIISISPGSF